MEEVEFTCKKCGIAVPGGSDHCSTCLWSKHTSGKKGKNCGGLMEPLSIELGEERCNILYRCKKCGHRHKQKSAVIDNFEKLSQLPITQNEVFSESDLSSEDLILSSIKIESRHPQE